MHVIRVAALLAGMQGAAIIYCLSINTDSSNYFKPSTQISEKKHSTCHDAGQLHTE